MATPNGGWNQGQAPGGRTTVQPRSGLAHGGTSFFRKALSLATWLMILAMLVAVVKGMDRPTFNRLVEGVRVLRAPPPVAAQAPSRPPEPLPPAEAPAAPAEATDIPAPTAIAAVVPPPPVASPPTIETDRRQEPRTQIAQVVLSSYKNGNYYAPGAINGQNVLFVVDTGASAVSVPEKLRWKLNLAQGAYRRSATANGIAGMYETEIKDLSIGPIRLKNVQAVINPNAPDATVLLGMTALREVRMVQEDGHMILQQEIPVAAAAAPAAPPPPKLKRPLKDCMGDDKVINAHVLKCMQGAESDR